MIIFILLFSLNYEVMAITGIPDQLIKRDTIPPSEVFQLKRSDIYVVIIDQDKVNIRLKNDDSIVMNRAMFDTLSADVKKEISANRDGVFSNSFVEPTFPGGPSRWVAFLNRDLRYPAEAQANNIQGSVVVQFLVDVEGNTSNFEVISGPESGGLREETVRIFKKSGKWTPAVWNGYKINALKRQPLTFRL